MIPRVAVTMLRAWPAVGGAELHTREVLRRMASEFDVRVWCLHRGQGADWVRDGLLEPPAPAVPAGEDAPPVGYVPLHERDRRTLRRLHSVPLLRRFLFFREAGRRLVRRLVPILAGARLVHNIHLGAEYFSVAVARAAERLGLPFVFTPLLHFDRTLTPGLAYLLRRSAAVVSLTRIERDRLIEMGAPPDRVHVGTIGPMAGEPPGGVPPTPPDPPRILFLGRKSAEKGCLLLLGAAPRVWATRPDAQFVFAGPETPESEAAFRGGTDPRIVRLGPVPDAERDRLLAEATAVCLPSRSESFGGSLLDGWQWGRPIIAGDIPCSREIVTEGEDGFLVPVSAYSAGPHSASSASVLADRILAVLASPERARAMGEAGRRKVLARHTWEIAAARLAEAYRAAASRCGRPAP